MEATIESGFLDDLGLKPPKPVNRLKAFAVAWRDFERWSTSYNRAIQSGADITQGEFPVVELGSILEMVQYGTSEKANEAGDGAAVIRMNNIVNGSIDLSSLKHIKLRQSEVDRLTLTEGDLLINRTNSKELVGKCAVFHEQGIYVFASYLIRMRTKPDAADPDFIARIINSSIGRQQVDALSRQIIGQANINSEEIRSLQIPLPPLKVQREIMQRVSEGQAEIAHQRAAARQRADEAKAELEALILGTKKVSSDEA